MIIGTLTGFGVLIWTLGLVKKDLLILKFGLPWIGLSIFTILFSVNSQFAVWLTKALGFESPANVYFAVTITSLISLGILLSIEVTKSVKRLEKAASAIAICENNSKGNKVIN